MKIDKRKYKKEFLLHLLKQMLAIRRFEERAAQAYGLKKIGGFLHLYIGQEASAVGAVANFDLESDYVYTAYRDHGHSISMGSDPNALMAELYGKAGGISRGKGGSMHFFDVEKHMMGGNGIVGAHIPLAAGTALKVRYKKEKGVVCGDTHFDYDQSTLSPEAKTLLDKDVQRLKENPQINVRKAGYKPVKETIHVTENNTFSEYTLREVEPMMVTLKSTPSGATIYIDDVVEGKTNKQLFKFPGEYNLRLIKNKYETIEKTIDVTESGRNIWNFDLAKTTAILTIKTIPEDAEIWINGELKSSEVLELAPGKYRVEVKKEGWYSDSRILPLEKGQNKTETFDLQQKTGNLQVVVEPMETKVVMKRGNQQIDSWTGSKHKKDVQVGQYTLNFNANGYKNQKRSITILENKITDLEVKMERQSTSATQLKTSSENTHFTSSTTGTLTDIDGNVYQTVKIGDQWWMAENLKVTHYRNGDAIPNVTDGAEWSNLTTGAYCEYDNNSDNVATYGRLYNWYVVDDSRNIAPEGWHVPSDAEWKQLEMYLGMSQSEADDTGWRGTNEGSQLAGRAGLWDDGFLKNNAAFGTSGLNALPAGRRGENGDFECIYENAFFWSSTNCNNASIRSFFKYSSSGYWIDCYYRQEGYSVRCVKD